MRVTDYLAEDHARLHRLLARAASEPFDHDAFEQFRGGLLRHIGIEEKLLFSEVRRRLGEPLAAARRLRIEHAALTSLLVPTPNAALVGEIKVLLDFHDAHEEGRDNVYARCEAILGDASFTLAEAARRFPAVPMARHFDGRGVHRTAHAALDSAERSIARRKERAGVGAADAPPSGMSRDYELNHTRHEYNMVEPDEARSYTEATTPTENTNPREPGPPLEFGTSAPHSQE